MNLVKYLKKLYNLPNNCKLLTVIDYIPMHLNFSKYQEELMNFANTYNDLTENEKVIIDLETSPYRYLMFLLKQNHFENYYLNLLHALNSVSTICSDDNIEINKGIINRVYERRNFINKMHDLIVDIYNKLTTSDYPLADKYDLKLYYNEELLERFIKSLDIHKPDSYCDGLDEDMTNKLDIIYDYLIKSSRKTKEYLIKLRNLHIFKSTGKYGLSNFAPDLYLYYINYRVGLQFNSISELEYLYNWAKSYLEYNLSKKQKLIKKICPNNVQINKDPQYLYSSKEELIDDYRQMLEKQSKIIHKYNIPYTTKCKFGIVSNQHGSGAFYTNNSFYLNTYDWENKQKYETRTLTMHEAYPGHHMQIDISDNFSREGYLTNLYYTIFTSYIEGWALFAESIHSDDDNEYNFGQLDANALRIIRIIADIDIHLKGKSPDDVIKNMSNNLTFSHSNIEAEVYRYIALPAQAMTYKVGETAFMTIYYKIRKHKNMNIDDPYIMEELKKILLNGNRRINHLLNEYSMIFNYN